MNTEILNIVQSGPFWDLRVALDLFLGGAGVGALLTAIFIDERLKGQYRRIPYTASVLAAVLIAAGLLLILWKLGRPERLFLTYTSFNPTSPLWWGGIFQPLLLVGTVVYAIKWKNYVEGDRSRIWLGRALVPLCVIVGGYHGLLLSVMVSRPLWNTGPAVVAALLAFLSTGIAVVMLVHMLRMRSGGRLSDEEHVATFLRNMTPLRNGLFFVLVLQLGTYFLWWLTLRLGSLADQQALLIASEMYGAVFWWIAIGAGIVLPIILGAWTVIEGNTRSQSFQISMIMLTSILILVGGFVFRYCLVLGGQINGELSFLL